MFLHHQFFEFVPRPVASLQSYMANDVTDNVCADNICTNNTCIVSFPRATQTTIGYAGMFRRRDVCMFSGIGIFRHLYMLLEHLTAAAKRLRTTNRMVFLSFFFLDRVFNDKTQQLSA
ncbi:MAG: hypothetical protein LBU65_03985 [Planctomycetaceae bacterium]|jgi:hypothetical protein|nr:hypothetical protein [Planctomycetaceae bacterium]